MRRSCITALPLIVEHVRRNARIVESLAKGDPTIVDGEPEDAPVVDREEAAELRREIDAIRLQRRADGDLRRARHRRP